MPLAVSADPEKAGSAYQRAMEANPQDAVALGARLSIREALRARIRLKVFDPHGTLVTRLAAQPGLERIPTRGAADITVQLQQICDEASSWEETRFST